jgi:hypothetical protein
MQHEIEWKSKYVREAVREREGGGGLNLLGLENAFLCSFEDVKMFETSIVGVISSECN